MPPLVLSIFLLAALFPRFLAPVVSGTLDSPYLGPGTRHLLGTDSIGQDLLSELISSARISLLVAFLASVAATFLGTLVGMVSGLCEGGWDQWLMRFTDVFLLLPSLPLIILLSAYMDSGVFGIALVIGMTTWPATARVVRANVRQERGKNYVRSAQAFGAGHLYVMAFHILPNISQVVLAKGTLVAATAMVAEAGVSFLGLGDPGYKSWGAMLHEAFTGGGLLNGAYLWYMSPIICISLTVLSLTLMGQRWLEGGAEDSLMVGAQGKDPLRSPPASTTPLLRVKGLSVDFPKPDGTLSRALHGLDMTVAQHQRLAVVGETGSGKSVLLLALMGLLPKNAAVTGKILFNSLNLCTLSEKRLSETAR
jgi:peptide/nickel transport system permease protein